MPRKFLISICVVLSGCALTSEKLYDGAELAGAEQVVIASQGLYPKKHLAFTIVAINGKEIKLNRTSEFLLRPGEYKIKLAVRHDQKSDGVMISWNEASVDVELNASAGHSYMPAGDVTLGRVRAYFLDLGTSFPRGCMPLRKYLPSRSDIAVPEVCPDDGAFSPAK